MRKSSTTLVILGLIFLLSGSVLVSSAISYTGASQSVWTGTNNFLDWYAVLEPDSPSVPVGTPVTFKLSIPENDGFNNNLYDIVVDWYVDGLSYGNGQELTLNMPQGTYQVNFKIAFNPTNDVPYEEIVGSTTLTVYREYVPPPTPVPPQGVSLTVSQTGEGIINPTVGTYSFDVGTTLTLSADPALGWTFRYWEFNNGASTENSKHLTIALNEDTYVKAVFDLVSNTSPSPSQAPTPPPGAPTYVLTLHSDPQVDRIEAKDLSTGITQTFRTFPAVFFFKGTVSLTAYAQSGAYFTFWSNSAYSNDNSNPYVQNFGQNVEVTAHFEGVSPTTNPPTPTPVPTPYVPPVTTSPVPTQPPYQTPIPTPYTTPHPTPTPIIPVPNSEYERLLFIALGALLVVAGLTCFWGAFKVNRRR